MHILMELFWTLVLLLKTLVGSFMQFVLPLTEKSVKGQNILITGAGSGIGRLMALNLARRGATVISWDINADGNAETVRQVKDAGGVAHAYTVDVSDKESIYSTAARVRAEIGEVDVLVNNAGIVQGKRLLDTSDAVIQKTFQVNLLAHFWTTKCFLPSMLTRNHGHIVTMASVAGVVGTSQLTDYCASKFGTLGFAESLDIELAASGKDGVQVTTVCPYFIRTGLFEGCQGRFPWLLPTLDPKETTDRIVRAILTNQKVLYIPKIMYFLSVLKSILPVDAMLALHKFLGATNFMDTFVGRQKQQ